MPAKRYIVEVEGLRELGVALIDDHLAWCALDSPLPPAELQQQLSAYPVGYSTECLTGLGDWLADLRATVQRGVVLLIDYGYPRHEFFHPDRSAGTLKCHYQHRVHSDPFAFPGLQDLTTAINFTDVAELAETCGFSLSGFTSQTRFLLSSGLESIIATASDGDTVAAYRLAQEAKRLLLPGEMGQTFKLMALSVDHDEPLIGFGDDERHRLAGFTD